MSGKKVKIDNYITGTKLKGFRQQKGLSLAKAAHEIGVTPAFISMVENGKCGISFEKVHSLVKLYGKTLEDITPPCRSGEEKVINLNAASEISFEPGIKAFGLAKGEDLFKLGGFRLYYEPGAEHTFYHCDGMEYVLVLEGTFEIYLQSKQLVPLRCGICAQGIQRRMLPESNTSSRMSGTNVVRFSF